MFAINSEYALAQSNIVPDGTLGAEPSIVTPNFQGLPVEVIGGGAIRGANLFHSFQEFNVSEGRGAYFFSPNAAIENILARVTGNNPSQILGTLGTFAQSNPNLFLINPNGISFGARARLNLGGSFFASTASSLVFADGTVFSAKPDTSTSPLLTISVPLGLQYGSNPGSIQVQGATLGVGVGQTLALVGGNVSLERGQLLAPGGRVELGGLAGEGTVGLVANGDYLGLSFPVGVPRGDVSLSNGAVVNVVAGGGGSIGVNASNLTMTQGSILLAGIASGRGAVDAVAGDIEINATGAIDLTDKSGIFNEVRPRAQGRGGDISITTSQLRVSSGAQVSAATFGQGNGGNLTIHVSKEVQVIGRSADGRVGSGLAAQVAPGATGKAGDLTINTGTLLVRDGAQVNAATFGQGNGGNLTVNASQGVQVIGHSADGRIFSGLFASTQPGARGNAGDLTINTDTLLVQDGAVVSASTFGQGDGGNLTVNASQQVQVIGTSADGRGASGLAAQASRGSSGKGGDVTINTGTLLVRDGAQLSTGTFDKGDGGNLTVNASKEVQVIGTTADGQYPSGLFASADPGARGKAGDLTINTGTLLVRNGAQVGASTFGEGDGGNLTVNASQQVQVIGRSADGRGASRLNTSAQPGARGNAGDLTINTDTLLVRDGAQVSAGTFAEGDGGNLIVNASQGVQLIGTSASGRVPSGLFASAERGASGKAGDVIINTDTLLVRDGAQVSVFSVQGQAGNMTILANSVLISRGILSAVTAKSDAQGGANITLFGLDLLRMDNESLISANALDQANGGNITIDSTLIVATPPTGSYGSDITANAGKGNGGAVNITTQGLFGIEFRPQLTPKNDITVTSEFGVNGTFQLTTPGVDPSRGLSNLPSGVIDASNQIVQNCRAVRGEGGEENKFIITGRGGLPPSPNEPLRNEEAIAPSWVTLDSDTEEKNNTTPQSVTPSRPVSNKLVEAHGWLINDKGQVVLTTSSPTMTLQGEWIEAAKCNSLQSTRVPQ
jgi:filamentous hemagglutinin family protein